MQIKEKLKELLNYYEATRQAGHTRVMLDAARANNNACILVHGPLHKQDLLLRCHNAIFTLGSLPSLRGRRDPLLIDNAALYVLFNEALKEIERLEGQLEARIKQPGEAQEPTPVGQYIPFTTHVAVDIPRLQFNFSELVPRFDRIRLGTAMQALIEQARAVSSQYHLSCPPLEEEPSLEEYQARDAVRELLHYIGEDPGRDGLEDTPSRVVKALKEMTAGYHQDASDILATTFSQDEDEATVYNGMVLLKDIEFQSLCEHHLLPFVGKAHIGYIPGSSGQIVGISKLARLVDCFAKRLQVQERLTTQIADAIEEELDADGVIVVIEASHYCMKMRGVGKQGSSMLTSEVRGILKHNPTARAEAFSLLKD